MSRAQREAFEAGAAHIRRVYDLNESHRTDLADQGAAKVKYPNRTTEETRVVQVTLTYGNTLAHYRFVAGRFELQNADGGWDRSNFAAVEGTVVSFNTEHLSWKAIADLLDLRANPTVTVELDD